MAEKVVQGKKMKQVEFEIDKNAFSGPFKCHGMKTKLIFSMGGGTQIW